MKALVKTAKGPNNLEIKEVAKPTPAAGEVLIKVKAAGVCGTDLHIRSGEWPLKHFPVVIGQELGPEMKVIATGGLAEIVAKETPAIQVVAPWLTLDGLRLIWEMNR
jgi:D-arabinose 1-dehydrogenase-like Zn-dependent alcohol dehydrogenase